jgi:hypothetical protein
MTTHTSANKTGTFMLKSIFVCLISHIHILFFLNILLRSRRKDQSPGHLAGAEGGILSPVFGVAIECPNLARG